MSEKHYVIVFDTDNMTSGRYSFDTEEDAETFVNEVNEIEYQNASHVYGEPEYQHVPHDELKDVLHEDFGVECDDCEIETFTTETK